MHPVDRRPAYSPAESTAAPLKILFAVKRLGAVDWLSVPILAALARQKGHEVDLVEWGRNSRRAERFVGAWKPDIVAYTICSSETEEHLAINQRLKRAHPFFAVFGGAHPTYTPSFIEADDVDAICRGEGDLAWQDFLDHFGTDSLYDVSNFAFRLPDGTIRENPMVDLITDLDQFPFPARDLLYARSRFMAENPIKAFMAGRGCPFSCAHCFNSAYNRLYKGKGPIVRTKSVGYLIREIQEVAARYPLRFVRFHDDVFGARFEWLAEFADRFPREVGLPFSCYAHPNMASEEYAELLARAGCHAVYTAIECGNETLRRDVLRRVVSNDQLVEVCRRFQRRGVRIMSFNMLGLPGETIDQMLETLELNRRIGVDFADVSVFQPYPGTAAFEYARERGFIRGEGFHFRSVYTESNLEIDPALKQRIFVLHKLFSFLIDHPGAEGVFRCWPATRRLNRLLNLFYRLHYGHHLHRRIYQGLMPLWVRLRGAASVLLSETRI